ncbi:MAG: biotin-dependent carboxyltransferase [Pyrinomonadaceae bacterium]|nr:biotin-dependent carboxyltransferase [Pyrinomonadaceae bacterium]
MSVIVLKSGIHDTVQDGGRYGFGRFGINPGGAMDLSALRTGNLLMRNKEHLPSVELHFPASEFRFEQTCGFSLSGGDFCPELDGKRLETGRAYTADKGAVLRFRKKISGERCYLSVRNGFDIESWLGSCSTNTTAKIGGFRGRPLDDGDRLEFLAPEPIETGPRAGVRPYENSKIVRFVPGPSFSELTAISHASLKNRPFEIRSDSDRMGSRLKGEPLYLLNDEERISAAVTRGTIQLLPDGNVIILMADHQTHGGYPDLGTVIAPDVAGLAQLGPGDEFRLVPISIPEAEQAFLIHEQGFRYLKTGLRLFRN